MHRSVERAKSQAVAPRAAGDSVPARWRPAAPHADIEPSPDRFVPSARVQELERPGGRNPGRSGTSRAARIAYLRALLAWDEISAGASRSVVSPEHEVIDLALDAEQEGWVRGFAEGAKRGRFDAWWLLLVYFLAGLGTGVLLVGLLH